MLSDQRVDDGADIAGAGGGVNASGQARARAGTAQVHAENAPAERAEPMRLAFDAGRAMITTEAVDEQSHRLAWMRPARRGFVHRDLVAICELYDVQSGSMRTAVAAQQVADDRLHVRIAKEGEGPKQHLCDQLSDAAA
jgi:hypothetical protein